MAIRSTSKLVSQYFMMYAMYAKLLEIVPGEPLRRGGGLKPKKVAKLAILDLSKAISRKWYKIGGKLLLITNRKSHMSFRLVPKSVTLNDLKRRNSFN